MDLALVSILVTLFSSNVLARLEGQLCPDVCICSHLAVRCSGLGVQRLDSSIPESVRYLDLSHNPFIVIEKNSLTRFKQLQKLNLKNCSIKYPIGVAATVMYIDLSHNKLDTSAVIKFLQNGNLTKLEQLYLSSNNIDFDGRVLALIPKGIRQLELGSNVFSHVATHHFAGFTTLGTLNISSSGLREIEPGAFDSLKSLKVLALHDNQLSSLPKKLFQFTKHLQNIYLYNNRLTVIPSFEGIRHIIILELRRNLITEVISETFGVKHITSLRLGTNRINKFNLTGISFFTLDLSRNGLNSIHDYAFSGHKNIWHLFLHNNKISNISYKAFDKATTIGGLFLQRNRIENLPRGIFKDLTIAKLFLFDNKLTYIEGFLDGMKRYPQLLLLFGNPNLHTLRGSDFSSLENSSVIYIGCSNLKKIILKDEIKAEIVCSPSKELEVATPTSALHGDGFHCHRSSLQFLFHCKPCFVGFRENCNAEYCGGTCIPCPAGGFYQDEMAAVSCKSCPLGQFVSLEKAPGKSALDCLTCPKGTNTNRSAYFRACSCLRGYARTYRFGECTKCEQKGFQCKRDYPELKRGYWMSWEGMKTAINVSCEKLFHSFIDNLNTEDDYYNRKTVRYDCNMPIPHKCPIKGSCLGGLNVTCRNGYKDVLCAVCSEGFMKDFGKCVKCPAAVIAVIQFVAYIMIFILLCWTVSLTDRIRFSESSQTAGGPSSERTFADAILSSFKILLGFYQVLNGTIHALGYIHWPNAFKASMDILQYIQMEIIRLPSLHCIRPDWQIDARAEFWLSLIAIVTVPIIILLYFAIRSLQTTHCCVDYSRDVKCKQRDCAKRCLRAAALFLFATYPFITTRIFRLLPVSCHTFCTSESTGKCANKVSYLRSDYRVQCLQNSGQKSSTLTAVYASSILPIGLPVVLLLLLWHFSRKPNYGSNNRELEFRINDIIETRVEDEPYINADTLDRPLDGNDGITRFALKFAYENYNANCWYWEVLEMLRKLIMSVGVVLFLQHTKVGLAGMVIIATFFALLHAAKAPIKDRFENFLQMLSLSIIPINLAIGGMLQQKSTESEPLLTEQDDAWALGILLVALNSVLIVLVVLRLTRAVLRKLTSLRTADEQLSCCKRFFLFCCGCIKVTPIDNQLNVLIRGSNQ